SRSTSRDASRPAQTSPNYRLGRPEATRQAPERPPQTSNQRDAGPRENRPDTHNAPSSASAPVAPQANRNPESVARSNPNRNPDPVMRSNPSSSVEQPTRTVPPGQARQGEPRGRQPEAQNQNAHVYYPKSYYQSAEVKSLPPERAQGKGQDNSRKGQDNSHNSKNSKSQNKHEE